ncbi:OmpA/MotB domain-containing protein, partial [Candidatus Thiomargarita nelsonii]
ARYGVLLQAFSGDSVPLKACLPFLEKTLQSESKAGAQKARLVSPSLIVILSVALLAALGWGYWHFQSQQRLSDYVEALRNTPGFVVISSQEQDGKLLTYGMRDPLAIESREIAQAFNISDDEVGSLWTPYQDLSPAFVEKRVRLRLKPPSTVSVRLEGDVLYLSGHASQDWIDKASASIFPDIERVVMDDLLETDLFLLELAKRTLL